MILIIIITIHARNTHITIKSIVSSLRVSGDLDHSMLQSIPPQFDTKLPTWGYYDEYDASNNLDLYSTVQLQRDCAWMRTLGIGKLCADMLL